MSIGNKADKKEYTSKQKKTRSNAIKAIVSAAVAVTIFIGLLVVTSSVLNQEKKIKVYRFKSDLVSNTKVGADDFDNYFYEDYQAIASLPVNAITDLAQVTDQFISRDVYENEIATTNNIGTIKENITSKMVDPIKLSFQVANVPSGVAGEIREGDLINIYSTSSSLDATTGEKVAVVKLVAQNVYVKGAYQADGTYLGKTMTITSEDSSENVENGSVAMLFNILVPQTFEQEFIMYGVTGNYFITKVLDVDKARESIFGVDNSMVARTMTDVSANTVEKISAEQLAASSSGSLSGNESATTDSIGTLEMTSAEVVNGELVIKTKGTSGKTYDFVIDMETKCEKGLAEKLDGGQKASMEQAFRDGLQDKEKWKDYFALFKQYSAEVGYTLPSN